MSCMYFYLLYFLQVQWSNEGCWCEIMATLPRAPHIMWQWKVGRLGRALFVWLAGRKVWGAGDHCASVNMGRRLLKCCHRFWLNTEQPQNSQTSVFGLLTFHAWFWQMRMWLCGLCVGVTTVCHCTDHSQLSHGLSFTVLLCPLTTLHTYCFLLLCCSWPKFLHLQLTAFKSDKDDPPTPTISMEWASLATVQCTVHFQKVSVFYYK
jgi:hypothetical protein